MVHDCTEGQVIDINGTPIAIAKARGGQAIILVATAGGDEQDGPLPVETPGELRMRVKKYIAELATSHTPRHN